jgi:hypothetical protein
MTPNELTMAILTHPVQAALIVVTLSYAFRDVLSALQGRKGAVARRQQTNGSCRDAHVLGSQRQIA